MAEVAWKEERRSLRSSFDESNTWGECEIATIDAGDGAEPESRILPPTFGGMSTLAEMADRL